MLFITEAASFLKHILSDPFNYNFLQPLKNKTNFLVNSDLNDQDTAVF